MGICGGGGEGSSQSASCGDLLLQTAVVCFRQSVECGQCGGSGAASEKTVAV